MRIRLFVTYLIVFAFFPQDISYCQSDAPTSLKIAIPLAGNCWVINYVSQSGKIINSRGTTNWIDKSLILRTYFRVEQTGRVNIELRARAGSGTSDIAVTCGSNRKSIKVSGTAFDTTDAGSFTISKPGYQYVDIQGISTTGTYFADISDVIISGPATEGKVNYVKDDFYFGRRGPSVHLRYDVPPEASDIVWFYNELTVPEGNDVIGSYFMANGFADGYFGIQVNSETERRILFSVWSPYKTDNPGDIPDEYKIILLKKGTEVITKEFGNEGSGGQSYRRFFWEAGVKYRFLLRGEPSENNSTDYTAYFYDPRADKWDLIASFRRPMTNNYLKSLYSFLENFTPDTGPLTRKGLYSNQWILDKNGKWYELQNAKFTADATARKESRLDYSGGVADGAFFLRNCGFFSDLTKMDINLKRKTSGKVPDIDFSSLQ